MSLLTGSTRTRNRTHDAAHTSPDAYPFGQNGVHDGTEFQAHISCSYGVKSLKYS